jgi:hypothetical protein
MLSRLSLAIIVIHGHSCHVVGWLKFYRCHAVMLSVKACHAGHVVMLSRCHCHVVSRHVGHSCSTFTLSVTFAMLSSSGRSFML